MFGGQNVRNISLIPSALAGSVPRSRRYAVRPLARAPKCNSGRFDDLYPVWSERWNHDFQKPRHTYCVYICRCVCICQPEAWVRLINCYWWANAKHLDMIDFFRFCEILCRSSASPVTDQLCFILMHTGLCRRCGCILVIATALQRCDGRLFKKKSERWWLCETPLYWMKLNLARQLHFPFRNLTHLSCKPLSESVFSP